MDINQKEDKDKFDDDIKPNQNIEDTKDQKEEPGSVLDQPEERKDQLIPFDNPRLQQQLAKPRQFWNTQPVPKNTQDLVNLQHGPLEKGELQLVKKDGYSLLDNFEWCEVDLNNDDIAKQVYTLLAENYVEDDDNMFRFDYSIDFLRWALLPPGYYADWIIGVRVKKSQKLVGFITGIPVHLVMEKEEFKIRMTEINFLCVHKKLRANRLAPVLIKEITRRVHLRNMWQAVYTAGIVVPTPIAQTRYYHRSLNPKKLIEVGFSSLGPKQTISRQQKLYKLPDETKTPGLRPMKKKDVSQVFKLLSNYLKQFKMYFKYTEEEVKHWLMPRKDVIYTYVVEGLDENKSPILTDFISFYSLPSSIINNPKYTTLKAAYSYYNVSTKTPWITLMTDSLILAKSENFDVFNILDIMENETFLKDLMFSAGDGQLNYYLYNWKLQSNMLQPKEIGIVLV